ncbi:MAG: dihydrodipicolinate synthase family protein [Candidatus Bathyarchaeota archaeon]|nr:dihydrodipicolinate synthase family protein [Candidatus Bathyarchaeota archaeon]
MTNPNWAGVFPALCTVTNSDGDFDEEGMRAQVRANINWGADGVCSTIIAGEFYKFSEEERMRIAESVIDEARSKIPVLVGVSHSGTELAVRLARHAENAGADGLIAMVPYFSHNPSKTIVERHISAICEATNLPVMFQDAEDATGIHICPTFYIDLSEKHSNLASIKLEGPGTLDKLRDIGRLMPGRVSVFGGMAAKLILQEAKLGADGTIPSACLTDIIKGIWSAAKNGNSEVAETRYARYKQWVDFFHSHPGATAEIEKETLRFRNIIENTTSRSPRVPLTQEERVKLTQILDEMKLKNS